MLNAPYRSRLVGRTHYVYRAYAGTELLYVGVTVNLAGRVSKHRHLKPWWSRVTDIKVEACASREAAFDAEREAIIHEQPSRNIARPRGV